MRVIAGIDIGNATTETVIGLVDPYGKVEFKSSSIVKTTGIKGTKDNIAGVYSGLKKALDQSNYKVSDLDLVRINEAAPVIGDVAMETITETIITESTMIGHNPTTPGGLGLGVGISCDLADISQYFGKGPVIILVPKDYTYEEAAFLITDACNKGADVKGAIVELDDGVLINNRIPLTIPIIDEVLHLDRVPRGMLTAVEVSPPGGIIETLSNPYGVATVFGLSSEETKMIVPIARALIGNRSAVVIKTPKGDVQERRIPAGEIKIIGEKRTKLIDIEYGAEALMKHLEFCAPILDITGEAGTNAGGMLEKVRQVMANLTEQKHCDIKIQDLLAVDTISPQKVQGGVAEEFSMENAVGVAAMVKADSLQMNMIADTLHDKLGVPVEVGGVEAEMAIMGALTTPGTDKPLAILDMGAGSTDASIINRQENITLTHLAGAGNMVTLLIQTELGLDSFDLAEDIKKYPLAKVESLFHIRHEDGTVQFFKEPLDAKLFSRVIILKEEDMIPIMMPISIEKVKLIRKEAKRKVFVTNAIRALKQVSLTGDIRDIEHVVLVGGSALDFEVPQLVTDALSQYGVVAGRGNIRGSQGPRNAVATGLVLSN